VLLLLFLLNLLLFFPAQNREFGKVSTNLVVRSLNLRDVFSHTLASILQDEGFVRGVKHTRHKRIFILDNLVFSLYAALLDGEILMLCVLVNLLILPTQLRF
jgi:hypothetical protein